MSTLLVAALIFLGAFLSFFTFWIFLKEDYEERDIFSFFLLTFFAGFLGFWLAQLVIKNDSLLVGLFASFIFGFLRARRLKMRLAEVFEAGIPAIFVFLLFFSLIRLVLSEGFMWQNLLEPALITSACLTFVFFKKNYRQFLWYPSGRIGFSSLVSVLLYFLVRTIIAILAPDMLFLFSRLASLFIGVPVIVLSGVALYIQSGRDRANDFSRILGVFKR